MKKRAIITRDQMFEPLLEACPTFEPRWQAFLKEYGDEPELPQYLALSELAEHLIETLEKGPPSNLRETFRVVERWHLEGDDYVKEAASIGLLEDLQNENLHSSTTPDQFVEFLMPESKKWWDKVNAFWEKGELITDS